MKREFELLPLFAKLISESYRGRRLKPDGKRIKKETVDNYTYAYKHLCAFSSKKMFPLRIKEYDRLTKRQREGEGKYWKRFYFEFTQYLFSCGFYDNYVGTTIKIIRMFFNYLQMEKQISTGNYHQQFYVNKEEVPIILITYEQLQYLIFNKNFEETLPSHLQQTKDVFVFGCTVALRFSDIFNIMQNDFETLNGKYYLKNKSLKTDTETKILLPDYAIRIFQNYKLRNKTKKYIFTKISMNQFNENLKKIGELAGWTHDIGKKRCRQGKLMELLSSGKNRSYRFCDLLSSHVMRRTAITTMLTLGMPEHLVRKISGHAANSKAFYRYVNYAQPYLDKEMERVHERMRKID